MFHVKNIEKKVSKIRNFMDGCRKQKKYKRSAVTSNDEQFENISLNLYIYYDWDNVLIWQNEIMDQQDIIKHKI